MNPEMIRQTMFTFGEVDEVTWKRTDIQEYITAAQDLTNCEVGTTGLVKKRKGSTLLINATSTSEVNSSMYEFSDIHGNYYILESKNLAFNIYAVGDNNSLTLITDGIIQNPLVTPYLSTELQYLDYTEDNDSVILTHPNHPPARIYITQYNPPNYPTFAYQVINISPYPTYDFNNINYSGFTVSLSVSGNTLTFNFTNLSSDPGFGPYDGTSPWINGQILGLGSTDLQPLGYANITNVQTSGSAPNITVTFTGTIVIPFESTAGSYSTVGSQYSIRQPAWSVALGYPAKTLYFQNRLWFANTPTLNSTIFGSKINQPINFDVGTGRDSEAIVYTLGQTASGEILWLNGGKQLEIYCQNDEFACPQEQNTGLTPATFSIRQQSTYGSSPYLKPITYINDSYYLNKTGKSIINYHFTGVGLAYQSTNVSLASSHLVKNPTSRAILQGTGSSQDNFIYFLNQSDNTITSFQFSLEYKLAALTPITFSPGVELIDIVTVNNTIFILKYYTLTDQFTIEMFDDSTRIDANSTYTLQSSGLVTGLSLFNGYTVQAVYQNQDFGQYLVVDGEIAVLNPNQYTGNIQIGLLYDVVITPMYPYAAQFASPFKKQVQRIYVDYYESLVFSINGDIVPYQNFADIQAGLPLMPQTDTAIVDPFSGWNRFDSDGTPIITITQSSPFDLKILGIGYQIQAAVL